MKTSVTTHSEAETRSVAAEFAGTLASGDVVALTGDLGAGKTVFVKGIAAALGFEQDMTSPTFTLIHEYRGPVDLYHMDLYRMETAAEMAEIGLEDYLYGDGICLVEWAEKMGSLRPPDAIRVNITHLGGTGRRIDIERT